MSPMQCLYGQPSPYSAAESCATRTTNSGSWCALCLHREYLATLRKLATERERREFMQTFGRYIGWGLIDDGKDYGVVFTNVCEGGPYTHQRIEESYRKHGWTGDGVASPEIRNAAEVAVIDRAIALMRAKEVKENG